MPRKLVLYQFNTQIIELQGLTDAVQGTYQDTATITCSLWNNDETPVEDTVLKDLSFTYVDGSDGIYRCTVPSTFDADAGSDYTLKIDVTLGANAAHFEIPVDVCARKY